MILESALHLFEPMQDCFGFFGRKAFATKDSDEFELPRYAVLPCFGVPQGHTEFALAFDRHFEARLVGSRPP